MNLTVHTGASGLHNAGYFSFSLSFSLFDLTSGSLAVMQSRQIRKQYIKAVIYSALLQSILKFGTFTC